MGKLRHRRIIISIITAVLLCAAIPAAFALTGTGSRTRDDIIIASAGTFTSSNRYTQPEQEGNQGNPYMFTTAGYDLAAEDGATRLYIHNEKALIMLEQDGYLWHSAPHPDDIVEGRYNVQWQNRLHSLFLTSYIDSERNVTGEGGFENDGGRIVSRTALSNGIRLELYLDNVLIGMTVELTLENGELLFSIDNASIREDGHTRLLSITPLPYFGTTYKERIPGYIFVPDGPGALMRFSNEHPYYEEAYSAYVYGEDYSISFSNHNIGLGAYAAAPVFGITHGFENRALFAVLEEGRHNAMISASLSGAVSDFNNVCAVFTLRHTYFAYTGKDGSGFNTYQRELADNDISVRYIPLSGKDADYNGMALCYRQYLAERGMLPRNTLAGTDMTLHLELVCADSEPGLFRRSLVPMTTFDQASAIIGELRALGVRDMSVTLQGWNSGGATDNRGDNHSVERRLGGVSGLRSLVDDVTKTGSRLYLGTSFDTFNGRGGGYSARADTIRLVSGGVYRYESWDQTTYMLAVPVVNEHLKKEIPRLVDRSNGAGLNMSYDGYWLFSDHNPNRSVTRSRAAELLEERYAHAGAQTGIITTQPHDFLWKHIEGYNGFPLFNYQYVYFSDTVPFLSIVLHGTVRITSDYINLAADPREMMLRNIEYGAEPGFILSHEPAWKLLDTRMPWVFSSQAAIWTREAAECYAMADRTLGTVRGVPVSRHEALEQGRVRITYENGARIYINYTGEAWSIDGLTVGPRDAAADNTYISGVKA